MQRRQLLRAAVTTIAAMSLRSYAQQIPVRVYRVGFLGAESAEAAQPALSALLRRLRELGYVQGGNLLVDVRLAQNDYERLPRLAAGLAALRVDVLVASGSKAGIAAKKATSTIPVVVSNMGDAVRAGFSESFALHGGNVTGVSMLNPEVTARQLQLLHEIKPGLGRVAVLANPANPNYGLTLATLQRAADAPKVAIAAFDARTRGDIKHAVKAAAKAGFAAMIVQSETLFSEHAAWIASLAIEHRIAAAGIQSFGRAGGLVGYSASSEERWRHVADYVDRILKGAKPSELPIEQPTKFDLVLNLKTAAALGITIPQPLLLRADEVIR